jgi:phosphohistidine phosphatase
MKNLLLLRHAKSDWNDASLDDLERPLNNRGVRDAPRMGKLMREEKLLPDLVISSDALRARRTVELIAEASGYRGEIRYNHDLYAAPLEAYLESLTALEDKYEAVMTVGHNPAMEELLYQLSGERQAFPTAALAHIRLPIKKWSDLDDRTRGELVHLWRPKEL